MAGRAPAREKSSFAVTCSLLSQYLKEKKGGGLQGICGLGMAPPAAAGPFRPPTTMNLLSALDAPAAEQPNDASPPAKATTEEPKEHDQQTGENQSEEEAQQLTIFYGGKVVVFDKFPSTKVKDLLQIVNTGGDGATAAPQPSQNSLPAREAARRCDGRGAPAQGHRMDVAPAVTRRLPAPAPQRRQRPQARRHARYCLDSATAAGACSRASAAGRRCGSFPGAPPLWCAGPARPACSRASRPGTSLRRPDRSQELGGGGSDCWIWERVWKAPWPSRQRAASRVRELLRRQVGEERGIGKR